MMKRYLLCLLGLAGFLVGQAQPTNENNNKFRQLYDKLPTPNVYRSASGAPGHKYWQQKADYLIELELDDASQKIYGTEKVTYHNNSPDELTYLWVQLDQNFRAKDSDSYKIAQSEIRDQMDLRALRRLEPDFDGGFKIDYVQDGSGGALPFTIVKTMMRVDLPNALAPGASYTFQVKWWYNINDRSKMGGRSGYEYFPEEENYLYTIAQFFPRMAVYIDDEGWQNKQFLGSGEFTLTFGDYDVKLTVPADHYVAATGVLQNAKDVLSKEEQKRWEQARQSFDEPVMIVNPEEALKHEQAKSDKKKTWHFKAENVRDFAFASSRKFIWDAMAVKMSDKTVMAMSMYPKEGNPLWEMYSTKVVAHTLKWYSHYSFDYPYPVAWSIHTDRIGMEYPMICFNGGRPEADGTYSERTKYGMISVIIHEVGHNYFPMIVNSDERQWTWMDEGLNTFLQYLTEQQWERDYPSRRGPADKIVEYMKGDKSKITPIMTNSESLFQFGNNAYAKPATALNILRETIMGRELFDFAFKTYCVRWKFKHPSPADFFRTMEDASGVDLDWFWRGWFYTNDNVDLAITNVRWLQLSSGNPELENALTATQQADAPINISTIRNAQEIEKTQDEIDTSLRDFYTDRDPLAVDVIDQRTYKRYYESLDEEEKALLDSGNNYYELTFQNIGGLVMPLIVEFRFEDGGTQLFYIPAEIWRFGEEQVKKVFVTDKVAVEVVLDPYLETADVNTDNNYFPARTSLDRFELFKQRNPKSEENPMQRAKRVEDQ
ncbi:MAG: M1 family metallopeptidase [Saprospiraceae bacterium]|nr:M1 family metallopeptidase [Saprospiraceae bacterium]